MIMKKIVLILILIITTAFILGADDFTPVEDVTEVPDDGYFISKETAMKIAARNIEYTSLKDLYSQMEDALNGQKSTLQEEVDLLNEINALLEQKYLLEKDYRLEIQDDNDRLTRNNTILGVTNVIGWCIGLGLGVGIWAYASLSP